ncbi:MAG TPA: MFS transporter [Ktedonobacteraceae bacterium]|nr:MFS transporter [Ktedonobacteraceae bacterium]
MSFFVSLARVQTFRSLQKHRNYRLYFSGNMVSQIGNWLQNGAQAWLILDLTHSAAAVGVLSLALYGPYALVGLIGGTLSDRFEHRTTLLWTQTALLLCASLLAGLTLFHSITVWEVDAIAAARSLVLALNNPSRVAFLVQMVGREELPNAVALNASVTSMARIIGPGIAGLLIEVFGTGWCFALNATSYLGVVFALLLMNVQELYPIERKKIPPLWQGLGEGLRYIWRVPSLLLTFLMLLFIMTVSVNFSLLIPVLTEQTLHSGPEIYGILFATLGVGSLTGALLAASFKRLRWSALFIGAGGLGVFQIILAPFTITVVCAGLLLLTGVCYTLYTSTSNAIIQLATPKHFQGRIAGLSTYIVTGVGPLGTALSGWLSQEGGTSLAFLVAGGVGLLTAIGAGTYMYLWKNRLHGGVSPADFV